MKKHLIFLTAMLMVGQLSTAQPDNPPYAAIGDILCTDGTYISPDDYAASGKTAMGVIFYVDKTGRHGWAAALKDCNDSHTGIWGPHSVSDDYTEADDVPGLNNYTHALDAIHDMDGEANTYAIKNYYGNDFRKCGAAYYAFYWDHLTNFSGTEPKGWYLPAAGQLNYLWAQSKLIDPSLSIAGGEWRSGNVYYWSSTEYSSSLSWNVYNNGNLNTNNKNTNYTHYRVRCVRNF